tara:strand:+ start:160 stop:663 length:504 start_codon:yes stop_codon:yes gene_type:complete
MGKKIDDILSHGEFKKKKRINSRTKGNTFERKISSLLNERFGTKEFCRTPGSGAFATTHVLPQHIKVHGDLITPEKFRFVIECKNGYTVELDDLFKHKSDFWDFIKQARRDGEAAKKDWLMIYQKTRRKSIVVTNVKAPMKHIELFGDYYMYSFEEFIQLPVNFFFI